jgi:branched-chain amino acid aminotransferase
MVTESTRTFNHKPFRLRDHLVRLYKSLKVTRMDPGLDMAEMERVTLDVVARNMPLYDEKTDLWIVHNVSRGAYPPSGDQSVKRRGTVIIHTAPLDLTYWAEFYVRGCHAVTPPSRVTPFVSLDAKIKNRSRMGYTLAELEVKLVDPRAQGILLDPNGYLAENKGGNFFVVADGILRTPRTVNALAGITRDTTLMLARGLGLGTVECDLQPYDVYTAEEAFFTSTPYCIMPATRFNGLPVGDGKVGATTQALLRAWSEHVGQDIVSTALSQLEARLRLELEAERSGRP